MSDEAEELAQQRNELRGRVWVVQKETGLAMMPLSKLMGHKTNIVFRIISGAKGTLELDDLWAFTETASGLGRLQETSAEQILQYILGFTKKLPTTQLPERAAKGKRPLQPQMSYYISIPDTLAA